MKNAWRLKHHIYKKKRAGTHENRGASNGKQQQQKQAPTQARQVKARKQIRPNSKSCESPDRLK